MANKINVIQYTIETYIYIRIDTCLCVLVPSAYPYHRNKLKIIQNILYMPRNTYSFHIIYLP